MTFIYSHLLTNNSNFGKEVAVIFLSGQDPIDARTYQTKENVTQDLLFLMQQNGRHIISSM